MLPNIKKIVYATDLSPSANKAFAYAAGIAEKFNAELIVLHVYEWNLSNPFLQMKGFKGEQAWDRIEKERKAHTLRAIEQQLAQMCAEMNSHVSACTITQEQILIRSGVPFDEILKVVRQMAADMIVIGTHGYGMVQDVLLGGTARRLVRKSSKPVVVVPGT